MDIYHALFWACGALCAIAELLILRAVFRTTPGHDASPEVPHSSHGVEIVWGVLPALALIAVFWASSRALL
ncbi:MAG TPA: hypothetical protein VNU46_01180 [Gemmatimonadaceae bacterium]|nr:hypothetical protein [Gemmatimonadaceae bacterium]